LDELGRQHYVIGRRVRGASCGFNPAENHVDGGTREELGSWARVRMELEIKRERVTDSVAKRRAAGKDLGGRRQTFTDSQIRNAVRLIDAGEPATQVARDLGMSRATLYRRLRELPVEAV
jgi:transcriptional regulator with PAS, ATPase and Fis domain